jgi:membrane-associated phospholipid phosphatase
MRTPFTPGLLAISALSAAAFTFVARAVSRRDTSYADGRARQQFPKRRRRGTKRVVSAIGPIGKEYVHAPIAIGVAAYAWRHGAGRGALVPPIASATAVALSKAFERTMPHRAPPPGRHSPTEPSFPSGHSLETTAVGATSAWVLTREGLVRPELAAPLALAIPLVSGGGRLYLDRHWTTDVLAGWLAGLSVAAACASLYETLRD